VDFQNDGEGTAHKAEVSVFLPDGIPFPASGTLNITATVKQQNMFFERYKVATENSRNTYQFVTTNVHHGEIITTQRKIIFRMPVIDLPGTNNPDNTESLRHGKISFTLQTSGDRTQVPECMYSDISIVFYSTIKGGLKQNPPIVDHTLTRRRCSHTNPLPDCPRYSKAGGPDIR
jgi:hypothetical protein